MNRMTIDRSRWGNLTVPFCHCEASRSEDEAISKRLLPRLKACRGRLKTQKALLAMTRITPPQSTLNPTKPQTIPESSAHANHFQSHFLHQPYVPIRALLFALPVFEYHP